MTSTTRSRCGPDGERLVGFDNAHPVAKQKRGVPRDRRRRLRTTRAYEYQDAAASQNLLEARYPRDAVIGLV